MCECVSVLRLTTIAVAQSSVPLLLSWCFTSTEARWPIRDGDRVGRFQARSKDQEILEEGGGAGPST